MTKLGENMLLRLNGQETTLTSSADLQAALNNVRQVQFSEMWLETPDDGPSLSMLVNGVSAWFIYFPDQVGHPGLSSRNEGYAGPPQAVMEFVLSNGQLDH
jgi:hypothetical protein